MASLKVPVTTQDHIQGHEQAPITLVQYGDYQCPGCRAAYPIIKGIQKRFGDGLRFVFRNFPLKELHPFAELAAEAAEFAAEYKKFWEMHDLIYENQPQLGLPLLLELAQVEQLPVAEFEKALAQKAYEPKIKHDFLGGIRSGVNGTPTFFINNERFNGSPGLLEAALLSTEISK